MSDVGAHVEGISVRGRERELAEPEMLAELLGKSAGVLLGVQPWRSERCVRSDEDIAGRILKVQLIRTEKEHAVALQRSADAAAALHATEIRARPILANRDGVTGSELRPLANAVDEYVAFPRIPP